MEPTAYWCYLIGRLEGKVVFPVGKVFFSGKKKKNTWGEAPLPSSLCIQLDKFVMSGTAAVILQPWENKLEDDSQQTGHDRVER